MTTTPAIGAGPLDRLTGFLLYRLGRDVTQVLAETLEPIGLGPRELRLLSFLESDRLSQRELGARAGVDRTTVVAVVDQLEEQGLVARERSESDRRKYLITLTGRGRMVYRTAMKRLTAAETDYLAVLTSRQQADLQRSLAQLYASRAADC